MADLRAPYASDPAATRGRLIAEPASRTRTEFQRDRDRIVHSTAFRRLAYKTQVFVHTEGDHFRTRLTHTIEVAQIARALARALSLDDDLAEAIALGHDLGHTPFGHTGEDALDECLRDYGGFEHNSHGLRIVTELERRYAEFDGLNLTQETVEGLVKHNGPMREATGEPTPRWRERGIPRAILAYDARQCLGLDRFASLEAQAAAIADDIAYNAHDIDDGLRAGLLSVEAIRSVPFIGGVLAEIERLYPKLELGRLINELTRRFITRFIEDAIDEAARRIAASGARSADEARAAGNALIAFSEPIARADREIKTFLFAQLYRHESVQRVRHKAEEMVRALFRAYRERPAEMGDQWSQRAASGRPERAVADYIAGMTDRFAVNEYRRLFDPTANLR